MIKTQPEGERSRRGNSWVEVPEVRKSWVFSRTRRKINVATAKKTGPRLVGAEVREFAQRLGREALAGWARVDSVTCVRGGVC